MKCCPSLIETIVSERALIKSSLQTKFKTENTSFRGLVQIVREKIALDQLADPDVSISEVAFMLGYSDKNSFNHAFKKWTGINPKAFAMTRQ